MPKIKTNKAMKKRFRVTKSGKVMGASSLRRHMLTDRSPKRKRQSRGPQVIEGACSRTIRAGIPY